MTGTNFLLSTHKINNYIHVFSITHYSFPNHRVTIARYNISKMSNVHGASESRPVPRYALPMDHNQSPLGVCPDCGRELQPVHALIEYEKTNGEQGIFAECPKCDDVVEPA